VIVEITTRLPARSGSRKARTSADASSSSSPNCSVETNSTATGREKPIAATTSGDARISFGARMSAWTTAVPAPQASSASP
jgi:hypothetical protein